ncbi:MAG: UDP-3-O-(3-hydroxymyristoyl)glucosamine N-acyltransferase [Acidobacteria bacterium]|nr:UDP-3-O-(3-hydroxymyristoyl)glucosamine N-acyltransferase [Acidobacteriota bacterium]
MSQDAEGRTVAELAALFGGRAVKGGDAVVRRVSSIEAAGAGDLAFVEDEKLFGAAGACRASCVIVPEGAAGKLEGFGGAVVEAARPKLAFALAAEVLHPPRRMEGHVHPTAAVAEGAQLGEGVYVGAGASVGEGARLGSGTQVHSNCVVGRGVNVGRDCVLRPNVVLYEGVTLGDRVVLHAGVVVGADGFGYVRDAEGVYHKFPQVGAVVIEDDVEVGANSCIDRGALGTTRVGRGSKIDNLVQVGHNVQIGPHCILVGQTGLAGSCRLGTGVVLGGQTAVRDHVRIGDGAMAAARSAIAEDVDPNTIVSGMPALPHRQSLREQAALRRLPDVVVQLRKLQERVEELENAKR